MAVAGSVSAGTVVLSTPLGQDALLPVRLTATERLSELFSVELNVISRGAPADLHSVLGQPVSVDFQGAAHAARIFHGILAEYAEIGRLEDSRDFVYRMVLRPKQYLATLNRRSRVFPNKTLAALITELGGEQKRSSLSESYPSHEYRVQYDESDFAFLSRHLEREGVYYFFEHATDKHELVLVDAPNAHVALTPASVILRSGQRDDGDEAVLWTMRERRGLAPTGFVVNDYDYTAPTTNLKKQTQTQDLYKRPHRYAASAPSPVSGTVADLTEHPGNYGSSLADVGQRYAGVRLDALRAQAARSHAEGNLFAAAVGRKLTVRFNESDQDFTLQTQAEYLIVATRHSYVAPGYRSGPDVFEERRVELELMPADLPFRPPLATPSPRIHGPQTALVIGPDGEEIHTDDYGRVKVEFFWDKGNSTPLTAALWARVAQISAGNSYGAFYIPRIGHEVVVEFLNGDPDRPIVTGCVYNGQNKPAFGTSATNPVQGIRTNSSKGGGGFNEIRLDDTKDSELFSVQAQKDLKTLVVKGDETRTIQEGKRTTTIKKDDAKTIQEGNLTLTVSQGDETHTITQGKRTTEINGNDTLKVKTGNREATVEMGDDSLTLKMGNQTTKLDLGAATTEAMQSITLKVGQNSVTIDQTGVTIKGMMVKIEAQTMMDLKASAMMQQDGGGMMMIKGGMVMIN